VQSNTNAAVCGTATNIAAPNVATPAIAAGGIASGLSATVIAPTTPGTWYACVLADNSPAGSQIAQSSTANDAAYSTAITVHAGQVADLEPQNINVSPNPVAPGGQLTVVFRIANTGNGSAPQTMTGFRILSNNTSATCSGTTVSSITTPAIPANNAGTQQTRTLTMPTTPGTYYACVIADNAVPPAANQTNTANDYRYSTAINVQASGTVAPELAAPSNAAVGLTHTPTLQWTGGSATFWQVNISRNGLLVHTSVGLPASQYSYSVPTGVLQPGMTYVWDVSACQTAACAVNFATSPNRTFSTAASGMVAPSLTVPVNGATGTSLTPLLQWSGGAAAYWEVNVSRNGSIVHTSAPVSATQFSYLVPSGVLQSGLTYAWDVSACPTSACTSNFATSPDSIFTTATSGVVAPTPSAPVNGVTGVSLTPTLQWTGGSGMFWEINISRNNGFIHKSPVLANDQFNYPVPSGVLQAGLTYAWDVTACSTVDCITNATTGPNSIFTTAGTSGSAPAISYEIVRAERFTNNEIITAQGPLVIYDGDIARFRVRIHNPTAAAVDGSVMIGTQLVLGGSESLPFGPIAPGAAQVVTSAPIRTKQMAWGSFSCTPPYPVSFSLRRGDGSLWTTSNTTLRIDPRPLIAVHGIFSSDETWSTWQSWMDQACGAAPAPGQSRWKLFAIENLKVGADSDPAEGSVANGERVKTFIRQVLTDTNASFVHVVSHSKGGFFTGYALNRFGTVGQNYVSHWLPISAPFGGSSSADLALALINRIVGPIRAPLLRQWGKNASEINTVGAVLFWQQFSLTEVNDTTVQPVGGDAYALGEVLVPTPFFRGDWLVRVVSAYGPIGSVGSRWLPGQPISAVHFDPPWEGGLGETSSPAVFEVAKEFLRSVEAPAGASRLIASGPTAPELTTLIIDSAVVSSGASRNFAYDMNGTGLSALSVIGVKSGVSVVPVSPNFDVIHDRLLEIAGGSWMQPSAGTVSVNVINNSSEEVELFLQIAVENPLTSIPVSVTSDAGDLTLLVTLDLSASNERPNGIELSVGNSSITVLAVAVPLSVGGSVYQAPLGSSLLPWTGTIVVSGQSGSLMISSINADPRRPPLMFESGFE